MPTVKGVDWPIISALADPCVGMYCPRCSLITTFELRPFNPHRSSYVPPAARMYKRPPHIAVIGAGFAGLRCADVLIQNGAKVTVFEARDRVGGRVG